MAFPRCFERRLLTGFLGIRDPAGIIRDLPGSNNSLSSCFAAGKLLSAVKVLYLELAAGIYFHDSLSSWLLDLRQAVDGTIANSPMSPEVLLRLSVLIPLIYAGLYSLTDPGSSIRVANKLMAEAHRIEANTLLGDLFAEPTPIPDSRASRSWLRFAGLLMMTAALLRVYSL
jgi:hypothetical protein